MSDTYKVYTVEEEITYGILADSTTSIAIHVLYIQVYDERDTVLQGLGKGQLCARAFIKDSDDFEPKEGLTRPNLYSEKETMSRYDSYILYLQQLTKEWQNS